MKLTKFTHACVRLEGPGGVLVIDPGIWSEPEALTGANAILITHEHFDHIDRERVAGLRIPLYAPSDAMLPELSFKGLKSGDELEIAGFAVSAVGGRHATIYEGQPDCANLGYVVDGSVYHPGDSVFRPGRPIETLLVPAHGAWLKTSEAIDFIRAVAPTRAFAIHDAQINERGLSGVNRWFEMAGRTDYRWLAPGETAEN
jgi:L-ascorbate metabolism protein UlaG (beta-lactamase superfamily)